MFEPGDEVIAKSTSGSDIRGIVIGKCQEILGCPGYEFRPNSTSVVWWCEKPWDLTPVPKESIWESILCQD